MNNKIMSGIVIAPILITSLGIITVVKTTLGDEATEIHGEEGIEKAFNIPEENEKNESTIDEITEYEK